MASSLIPSPADHSARLAETGMITTIDGEGQWLVAARAFTLARSNSSAVSSIHTAATGRSPPRQAAHTDGLGLGSIRQPQASAKFAATYFCRALMAGG